MIVVSDTSPILNLSLIHELDILRRLYGSVVIPPAVELEVTRYGLTLTESWIQCVRPTDQATIRTFMRTLDPGESEAITLAIELQSDYLLIDERLGRRAARQRGVRIIGLLGVLKEAKSKGFVESVKPLLDAMIGSASFWIGEDLYKQFLRDTGEA